MIKTESSQFEEKPKRERRSGSRGKTKEGTSEKIPERDSTQKAQTENYEQIKYEIAGESGGPWKHKTEKVCERK